MFQTHILAGPVPPLQAVASNHLIEACHLLLMQHGAAAVLLEAAGKTVYESRMVGCAWCLHQGGNSIPCSYWFRRNLEGCAKPNHMLNLIVGDLCL